MSVSMEQWEKIAHFPICPVQALEEEIVDKEILDLDLNQIDQLVEDLKQHEKDLRVLRQEIERRIRLIKMEHFKINHQEK